MTIRERLARAWQWICTQDLVDGSDVFFFGGLALAVIGGRMLSVAWTYVLAGVALAVVGMLPALRPSRRGKERS